MLILSIRTDKPDSELGLFDGNQQLDYSEWYAHRKLSATILQRIRDFLAANGKTLQDIEGLVVFQGPGSFTGLRLGITVANTLAYSLDVPIAAAQGDDWAASARARLHAGENDRMVLPFYDKGAHITIQKH